MSKIIDHHTKSYYIYASKTSVLRKHLLPPLLGLLLVSVFGSFTAYAQTTYSKKALGIDLDFGASMPTNKQINEVFHVGLASSLGLNIPPLQWNGLELKPVGGVKWYYKQIEEVNSVTEHFRTWKAGAELQYDLTTYKHVGFYPFLRIDHNWSANYYSETYNYDPWSNTGSTAYSDKYFKGTGLSYTAGIKALFDDWYIKLDYEYHKPTLDLNKEIIEAAEWEGIYVAPTHQFNFSALSISFGYDLNFRK